jgi:hypothetical protein
VGDKIEKNEMGGACSAFGSVEACAWFCWGPLGRPRRRWEDNIKMDLQEVGYGDLAWIELAEVETVGWHLCMR